MDAVVDVVVDDRSLRVVVADDPTDAPRTATRAARGKSGFELDHN